MEKKLLSLEELAEIYRMQERTDLPMFDFSTALSYIKSGIPVRRTIWHHAWVALEANSGQMLSFIYMRTEAMGKQIWTPQQDDLLQEDWTIAQ